MNPINNQKNKESIRTITISVVTAIICITVYAVFFVPEPDSSGINPYLESRLDSLDKEIEIIDLNLNQLTVKIENRDEQIIQNSATIHNSDRKYRDSIRAIYNPK